MPPEKRAPRPSHVAQPGKRVKRAEHTSSREAPGQALRELAALLGRTAKDLPTIRKTDEIPPRISIIDVITAITEKSARHAAEQLGRLVGRYPEVAANCGLLKFPGRRQRDTAVTDARGIIEVIMLMGGAQAARVRRQAAELVVRHPRRKVKKPLRGKASCLEIQGTSAAMLG